MSLVTQTWLESQNAVRGIFVEITVYDILAATNVVVYLSNVGYMTTDASISYNPIIKGGVQFSESISIDGSISMSFGDIEVNNHNGENDISLDTTRYVWVNRPIKIYLGDPFWVCADITAIHNSFELIFDGLVADVDAKSRESLNIKVRDKLERLNTVITEHTLGTYGTWSSGQTNQETIRPIIFGEVFNVEPILVDPSNIEYVFNDGNSELLIEIRDNGIPLYTHNGTSVTYNSSAGNIVYSTTGFLRLGHPLAGVITISAQGVKNSINLTTGALVSGTYSNNIANLIALIVTQYGKAPLAASELDLINLAAFATANTQSVGTYITDKSNILNVCRELLASIGAQLFMTRQGKLQILRLGSYTTDTPVTITDDNILHHSLQIASRSEVVASTKVGGCRNWTVQDNLLTLIPIEHKKIFKDEWVAKDAIDTVVQHRYILDALPTQNDSALIISSEILAEATRRNDYFKVPRTIYTFTGTAKLMSLKLGQQVTLVHNRFGLNSGKIGQVVSLTPNWLKSTIEVGVII